MCRLDSIGENCGWNQLNTNDHTCLISSDVNVVHKNWGSSMIDPSDLDSV